jgi:opacity protein-like surface antigen
MRLLSKISFVLLLASVGAFAQLPFGLGVKAGVPITDSIAKTQLSPNVFTGADSRNYIIGPMVELRLPFHLAVEADALYRPLNVTTFTNTGSALVTTGGDFSTWEFPVLAKYRFPTHIVKPYIEAGPSWRTLASGIDHLSNSGVTVGAGVEVQALLLRIAPEFRYTHWGEDSHNGVAQTFTSKQDQVEFLVGFSF